MFSCAAKAPPDQSRLVSIATSNYMTCELLPIKPPSLLKVLLTFRCQKNNIVLIVLLISSTCAYAFYMFTHVFVHVKKNKVKELITHGKYSAWDCNQAKVFYRKELDSNIKHRIKRYA